MLGGWSAPRCWWDGDAVSTSAPDARAISVPATAAPVQITSSERIVTVGLTDQDPLLALGVVPVGTMEYATLSAIAPTVAQPDEYVDWGVPWEEQTRTTGTAVGRAAEADALDVEALVWIVDNIEADVARFRDEPLYAQLPVATEARDVFVENLSELGGATSFVTVLSLPVLLDGLVPMLAAAVDGDPATPVQPP